MSCTWSTQDSPGEKLSFDELAKKLSQGLVSETTWVVSSHSETPQQIFDIPGLERAVRKLEQCQEPHNRRPVVSDIVEKPTPKHDTGSTKQNTGSPLAEVAKLVLRTKPNVAFVLISLSLLTCSIGCWKYSNSELMRFPRPADTPEVRVLPLVGDVPKTDFWIIQCCLGLAAIAAFEMSILRGQRSTHQ